MVFGIVPDLFRRELESQNVLPAAMRLPTMFLSRHHRYPKLSGCVAIGLVLNWLVLALGVPLPTWQAKDRSRPFPCMDSVCGCHTAEKCWQSCCCHTNAEKLVWAKRHGVVPPNYVVAAAQQEAVADNQSVASCCSKDSKSSVSSCELTAADSPVKIVARLVNQAKQSCSHAGASCSEEKTLSAEERSAGQQRAEADATETEETGCVVLTSVRRCQGGDTATINSELLTILVNAEWWPASTNAGPWIVLRDIKLQSHALAPTSPPPQQV